MSHVATLAKSMQEQKELIQTLMGFTVTQQQDLLFEIGMQWTERFVRIKQDVEYLSQQPEFWGWWTSEWYRLGVKMLERVHYNAHTQEWYCWKIDEHDQFHYISGKDALKEWYSEFMSKHSLTEVYTNKVLYKSFHNTLCKQIKH